MTTKVIIAYLRYTCTSSTYIHMYNISNNNPLEWFSSILDNKHNFNLVVYMLTSYNRSPVFFTLHRNYTA